MRRHFKIFQVMILVAVLFCVSSPSMVWADQDGNIDVKEVGVKGQQFLFMNNNAYNQEKNEWQATFTTQYLSRQKSREVEYEEDGTRVDTLKIRNELQWVAELEYGLTDWLQVQIEMPYRHVEKKTIEESEDGDSSTERLNRTSLSDVTAGFQIGLFKEDQGKWWLPTLAIESNATLPTGNWKNDMGSGRYGFDAGILLSKTIDKFTVHANVGGGYVDGSREQGSSSRTHQRNVGTGLSLVYQPTERLDLICELTKDTQRQNKPTGFKGSSRETEVYITPGIGYKLKNNTEIGLGVPIGLTYESYRWGIMGKILFEW